MLDVLTSSSFWTSSVSGAGPIALAALAAMLASRAGVLFLGVDGILLLSGFAGMACTSATGSLSLGILAAMAAGVGGALFFGWMSMSLDMGDIIAGVAVHILALGTTGFILARQFETGLTVGSHRLAPLWPSTGSASLDVVLRQPILIYICVLVALLMRRFLRTRWGLQVRAAGDSLRVSRALGLPVKRIRYRVLAASGAITGLGGAYLGLGIAGTFAPGMTSGRGFIALACVILASWKPLGSLLAALGFSLVYTYAFQVDGTSVGIQLLPYVLTVLVVALWRGARGPAEEGRGLTAS